MLEPKTTMFIFRCLSVVRSIAGGDLGAIVQVAGRRPVREGSGGGGGQADGRAAGGVTQAGDDRLELIGAVAAGVRRQDAPLAALGQPAAGRLVPPEPLKG